LNFTIGNKIALGFAVALGALVMIGFVFRADLDELVTDGFWVTHTVEVQGRLESLRSGLLQAEGSARGYALLADPVFQNTLKASAETITTEIKALRALVRDNPIQESRLDQLEPLSHRRLEELNRFFDAGTPNSGARAAIVRTGEQTSFQIRELIGLMLEEEARLLGERQHKASQMAQSSAALMLYGTIAAFICVGIAGTMVTQSITGPLKTLGEGAAKIGAGDYGHRVSVRSQGEVRELADHFNQMTSQVERRQNSLAEQEWLQASLARFAGIFQGQRDSAALCEAVLSELAALLDARRSALYMPVEAAGDRPTRLALVASYAGNDSPATLAPGEGLAGQCWVDRKRILLEPVPPDYFRIHSALGSTKPESLLLFAASFEGRVMAILEIGCWRRPRPIELEFLEQLGVGLGTVLVRIEGVKRTEELLRQAQMLSNDLQLRQKELAEKNQTLEAQAERLRHSELQLQEQQEELKQTNEELEQTNEEMQQTNEEMEEKVNLLAEQKQAMERANREIRTAHEAVAEKVRQVAQASRYKSEFLANMSHELRTPLNSLMILSKLLADNGEHNLTAKQVHFARTIHGSGADLLDLINEILDLSRIESGNVKAEVSPVPIGDLREFVESTFRPIAEDKKLDFTLHFSSDLPEVFLTDGRRLQQVLKNLLSNAFKFTAAGSVRLHASVVADGWDPACETLNLAERVFAFAVTDTGIGIPPEKQRLIFEAFQQADAGTSRKYGGTGLGLAISREIATLLEGALQVSSEPERGSTFTLFLPSAPAVGRPDKGHAAQQSTTEPSPPESNALEGVEDEAHPVDDDRNRIQPKDRVLLVIEDDPRFAEIMVDLGRSKGFKVVAASTASGGLALARKLMPAAVTLDLHLPDNDGWVVLDRMKHDGRTRHIPIHIISVDSERDRGLRSGAVSYLQKPVAKEALDDAFARTIAFIERPIKNLLIIEDDPVQRQSLVELIGNGDVKSTAVGSAADAFAALARMPFDCVVIDLGLPDMNGVELIREIQRRCGPQAPPVVVYTGKELSRHEETELRMISDSIVIKNARSPERLLDETALFLHRVQARMPPAKRRLIEQAQKADALLAGRKVLVVDDDVRNIFAITAALEESRMQVRYAESGQAALDLLQKDPAFDVVLMDVMMPEMDGFEAIRKIRSIDRFRRLPIISVTAKAMKGDRAKCLDAGASDYITKPVDMDQLRSLLRVWLYG